MQDTGKYRGITLLSHIMKPVERILDVRIRKKVEQELGEEHQGFRKGRGTTDGMFALRQMVEKRLEMQGRMTVGFEQKPGWWKQCMREQKEELWLDMGCQKIFHLTSV